MHNNNKQEKIWKKHIIVWIIFAVVLFSSAAVSQTGLVKGIAKQI